MRRFITAVLLMLIPLGCVAGIFNRGKKSYIEYVNPFVGTDFHGHTFPGAAYPFGMIQLSPDTRTDNWDGCSGYHYSDSTIWGFSHTHLSGTGCADYCDVLVMPVVDYLGFVTAMEEDAGREMGDFPQDYIFNEYYESPFCHSAEEASPGYYGVYLERWGVQADLSVGRRSAMHKYQFPKGVEPQLIIDLEHRDKVLDSYINQEGHYVITGRRRSRSWAEDQDLYFYMEFDRKIKLAQIDGGDGFGAKALITFKKSFFSRDLYVKVGISSVSVENARANVCSEIKRWHFAEVKYKAEKAWNKYLSKIEVVGDPDLMEAFYTALYHTAIAPNLYSDINGEYRGMDGEVHKAEGFDRYTVFSLWDTFRSLHPLLTIIERERTTDFIRSFLSIYDECGKLPIWELAANETNCMIGYHSVPVIADAIVKGVGGFDAEEALEAMLESSRKAEFGIDVYINNGLVLAEKEHESVSKTLEYAVDDWCIAQVAKHLGYDDVYNEYMRRAKYYRNIYDPSTGFMRPRINGIWLTPFDPHEVNVHYTEANSWQYTFHVPQDVSGLMDLFGGEEAFDKRLDDLFSAPTDISGWNSADMTGLIGQYVQGNEPSHHIAYLYPYVGKPWKTQEIAHKIMTELYTAEPDGLCGNEDCGQMSAWYVFSALGFYPVLPGSNQYVLGTPLFEEAVVHLEDGTDLVLLAPDVSDENYYVSGVWKNDQEYPYSYISYEDIASGAEFYFDMIAEPDEDFGFEPSVRPVSAIDGDFVENPWVDVSSPMFLKSVEVRLAALDPEYRIWYSVEPLEGAKAGSGAEEFRLYTGPFTLKESSRIRCYCENESWLRSHITVSDLRKISSTYKVTIKNKYSRQYSAGGDLGLVDGIRGSVNFRLGGWQGYQNKDFEAIIDLKEPREVTQLAAGFLQDIRSWIWMPRYVEFYTSMDGETYRFAGRVGHNVAEDDYTPQIHDLGVTITDDYGNVGNGIEARYIKVFAKNYGKIPKWHLGSGGNAFIFTDEVIVK
ncbi:MAG: glycoside hydrolase family 92 protein [Bacteroidales bacterium]|nr:glycoside hydrolase family 92 protein [Bacteroidales bacterium]